MKKRLYTLFLLFSAVTGLVGCSSDDDQNLTSDPVQQLPEATQVGANTAGALVNGEPITPQGGGISPNIVAFYQLINGEYFFNVGILSSKNGKSKTVRVFASENTIINNETYPLNDSGYRGNYSIFSNEGQSFYYTENDFTGELTITHLDETNRIVAGTFWFDAVNDDGEVVEVREGRFDVTYSQ